MVDKIYAHTTAAPSAPSTSDPANFPTRADAFLSYLTSGTEYSIQTSATDTTAGRLMKVAAFGLGFDDGSLPAAPGDDLDAVTAIGFYRYSSSTTGAPSGAGVMLHMVRISSAIAGGLIQVAWSNTGVMYKRVNTGVSPTTWDGWESVYSTDNILGTVSQSGGVPTGGLIESGSNANGYYERRANGSMECWHMMSASSGGAATWTFPSAFIEAPVVHPTAIATVNASAQLDAAPTTTAASFSVWDKVDARRADTVHLHAIGRWSTMT